MNRPPILLMAVLLLASLSMTCQASDAGDRGREVQLMLDRAVAEGRIPAGIAMLAEGKEIRWIKTAGEMEPGIPMRSDAILPLASIGKLFTATAFMILVERGELALDDPVSRYIPEFSEAQVARQNPAGEAALTPLIKPVTLYHLLTHTGGLQVSGDAFWSVWDKHVGKTTTTEFARDLIKLPLVAEPGTEFDYGQTGASYEVLAAVIEIVSKQTLEAFMQANIFVPLGMHDSCFYVPADKAKRLPAIYRMTNGVLTLERPAGEDFSRSTFFNGGGGVRSSPLDILKFSRLFLEGGMVDGTRILQSESVSMMMTDQLGDLAPARWQENGRSWGFGSAISYRVLAGGERKFRHYGWIGGGFSQLIIDPEEALVGYIGFPLDSPGDFDLLSEFEGLLYGTID